MIDDAALERAGEAVERLWPGACTRTKGREVARAVLETAGAVPKQQAQHWFERASEHAARAADAEAVLREIQENASSIADPHFRHWTSATVLSYFSALEAIEK